MKAKITASILLFALLSKSLLAQSLPDWIYTAPTYYSYSNADINLRNNHLFVQYDVTEIFPCNSSHASSVLLDDLGNVVWENVFDTTNACLIELTKTSKVIYSPSSFYYATNNYIFTGPDSSFTLIYNTTGQQLAENYVGFSTHSFGTMDDGFCYQGNYIDSIFKTDSLGNLIWQYSLPNSNNFHYLYPNKFTQRLIVTAIDYSQSSSDYYLRFIGLDTAGIVRFNNSINLIPNSNETVKSIWFTNDRKIYGVLSVPSTSLRFFSLDTAGSLNLPIIDLQVPNYIKPVYDSIHNLLHFFKPLGAATGKVYSLDCTTGIIKDSLFLDSIASGAGFNVDHLGNLIVASPYFQNSTYAFYVQRYTYNYYLDWTGVIALPYLNTVSFYDVKADTSNTIFLFYEYNNIEHIAKFSPPLVSGINEPNPYKNQLQLMPNPTSSEVTIRRKETSDLPSTLLIRDVSGKLIQQLNIPAHQTSYTFSTKDIPSGVYFVAWGTGVASKLVVIH